MRTLNTYSLVKALYDAGKDYIDAFWPFALQCLPHDNSTMAPGPVADEILRRFGLGIPVHTVETLLERAKRAHGYVVRKSNTYRLTEAGLAYIAALETPRQVERRVEALVDNAVEVLGSRDQAFLQRAFTQAAIASAIEDNASVFDFAVERQSQGVSAANAVHEELVLEYFRSLERASPALFDTLKDLILGSTLTGLLKRNDIADATRHFPPTELYLDTNFLLSALGLPLPVERRPAQELLGLLNSSTSFSLKVLDITLSETMALLRLYSTEAARYLPGIHVKALFASMRSQGYRPSDVTTLIANFEENLSKLGISVIRTGYRLDTDDPTWGDSRSRLAQFKPDQDERGQRHDLYAVDYIARLRKGAVVRKVEDGHAFFLTEDYRLSNFAFIARGHKDGNSVSEVMPDRLLTNLLWLKNPATLSQIPISTVIAMHSRDLFINKRVWERFYDTLDELIREGRLGEEDASVLLYDAQVRRDLACLGTGEFAMVGPSWLLDRLEAAQERQIDERASALELQAASLRQQGTEALASAQQSHESERIRLAGEIALLRSTLEGRDQAEELKRNRRLAMQKERAISRAYWTLLSAKALLLLGLGIAAIKVGPMLYLEWPQLEPLWGILSVVILLGAIILGWDLNPFGWAKAIENRYAEYLLASARRNADKFDSEMGVRPPPRV